MRLKGLLLAGFVTCMWMKGNYLWVVESHSGEIRLVGGNLQLQGIVHQVCGREVLETRSGLLLGLISAFVCVIVGLYLDFDLLYLFPRFARSGCARRPLCGVQQ